jgi:hypothetical protein
MLNILVQKALNKTHLVINDRQNVASAMLGKAYATNTNIHVSNCSHLLEANDPEVFKLMDRYMIVKENFLSEQEEASLLEEIEPYMKRLRYEFDHWDDVWYNAY